VFTFRLQKADKEIEVLLLQQQIRILERKLCYKVRINRWEKCLLAVLTVKLMEQTGKVRKQLSDSLLLFKPETVLGWPTWKALMPGGGDKKQYSRSKTAI
jgi:hypothetical protein